MKPEQSPLANGFMSFAVEISQGPLGVGVCEIDGLCVVNKRLCPYTFLQNGDVLDRLNGHMLSGSLKSSLATLAKVFKDSSTKNHRKLFIRRPHKVGGGVGKSPLSYRPKPLGTSKVATITKIFISNIKSKSEKVPCKVKNCGPKKRLCNEKTRSKQPQTSTSKSNSINVSEKDNQNENPKIPAYLSSDMPKPGTICSRQAYYVTRDNDSFTSIKAKLGLDSWKDLHSIKENIERYGETVTSNSKFKKNSLIRIPTQKCQQWVLKKLAGKTDEDDNTEKHVPNEYLEKIRLKRKRNADLMKSLGLEGGPTKKKVTPRIFKSVEIVKTAASSRPKRDSLGKEPRKPIHSFDFGAKAPFEDRVEALTEFKEVYGHCNVPIAEQPLGNWCAELRRLHAKMNRDEALPVNHRDEKFIQNFLREKQVDELKELGFRFSLSFQARFEELMEYKKRFGNCDVPYPSPDHNHESLGQWCHFVRINYRKIKTDLPVTITCTANVTEANIEELENIGFKFPEV